MILLNFHSEYSEITALTYKFYTLFLDKIYKILTSHTFPPLTIANLSTVKNSPVFFRPTCTIIIIITQISITLGDKQGQTWRSC